MRGDPGAWALRVATAIATASEDPWCQVGAVVLSPARLIIGTGYNGPPSGVELDWSDRDARRAHIIHAEANALRLVLPHQAAGGTLAVTHFPCGPCVNLAAAYGIRAIYWGQPPNWATYPREPVEHTARVARIKLVQVEAGHA